MTIVYALEQPPKSFSKSIFLAGPTPRDKAVPSWRPDALALLKEQGYDGVVFVPESRDDACGVEYDNQIEWEEAGLNQADVILFWVPRELATMPAFTTNVEYGKWYESGKCVLGFPSSAKKMGYLAYYAKKHNIPVTDDLWDTVHDALVFIGEGAPRTGGETLVPLYVWKTPSFQSWYRKTILRTDNRLDGVRVRWVHCQGSEKKIVFLWIIQAKVWVEKEGRHAQMELIVGRPDISAIVLFCRGETFRQTEVVLIREFRNAVANSEGYVLELPGGSSFDTVENPLVLMKDELLEETGISIGLDRIRVVYERQLMGTLSAHRALIGSVELFVDEMARIKKQVGDLHGNVADGEKTYLEVKTVEELLQDEQMDWSNLGMIFSALHQN